MIQQIETVCRCLNVGQRHHIVIRWDNAHNGGVWVDGKEVCPAAYDGGEADSHPMIGDWETYFMPLEEEFRYRDGPELKEFKAKGLDLLGG